jgi:exopolysaccharide production protein ExoQ
MSTISSAPIALTGNTRSIQFLPVAVGFFFSFRLLFVLLSVRAFNANPQAGVGAALAVNFGLAVAAAFASFGPARHTLPSLLDLASSRWVLLFIGFSGCSLFWSGTASMAAAIAFWCAMVADVVIVISLLRVDSADGVCVSLMGGYIWGSCAVAVIAWILPAQSDLRLGDEELLGPNQIGFVCAFAFFLAQYLMKREQERWTLPSIFLAITLFRSLSKTTIVAFLVAEGLMVLLDKSMSRKAKLYLGAAAIAFVAAFWGLFSSYYEVYTHAGDQAETLTGRIGIWAFILNEALQRPWIGHGFHSVWKVIPPFGNFEARHAHNELLQQFFAYGVVGVFIIVGLYVSVYRQIRRLQKGSLKTFFLCMLIFIFVRGLADTEAFDLSLPLWAIVLFGQILKQRGNIGKIPG